MRDVAQALKQQRERAAGQAHDVSDELDNIERSGSPRRASSAVERADRRALHPRLDRLERPELILAQDDLAERRAVPRRVAW